MNTYIIESLNEYLSEIKKLDKELSDLLTQFCPRGKYGAFDFDLYDDAIEVTGTILGGRNTRPQVVVSLLVREAENGFIVEDQLGLPSDYDECNTLDDVLKSIKDFATYRIENM